MSPSTSLRLSKDELTLKVVVRRVATGAAPYGWELHGGDALTVVRASLERFRSMEAAYKSGQVSLAAYLSARQSVRRGRPRLEGMTDLRLPSGRSGFGSFADNGNRTDIDA